MALGLWQNSLFHLFLYHALLLSHYLLHYLSLYLFYKFLNFSYSFYHFSLIHHIIYHIHSGNYGDITDKLDNGLIDFGVLIEPADLSLYDYIEIPTEEVWGILARRDSKIAKKKFIEKKDLLNLPIIVPKTLMHNKSNRYAMCYHKNIFL